MEIMHGKHAKSSLLLHPFRTEMDSRQNTDTILQNHSIAIAITYIMVQFFQSF